ncbi:MAG: NERD domain-containing protein [Caldilineales bacterium]|nr:NERD domain-containing protein [Caldilineales bacterium]
MTVSIWVGRPPKGYEAEHLHHLRRQLAPLAESYTLLCNFLVGQREIDLVALKHDGMFLVEHKFCDAALAGNINGAWRLSLPGGEVRELNGGRENPYQQTLFNFAAFSKWMESNKVHFLAPGRAGSVRFFGRRDDPGPKPMRIHNLLVVSPDLHADSCLDLDWRVKVIGAPALLEHLAQPTPRVDLSPDECTAIARELWLSPWGEGEREGRREGETQGGREGGTQGGGEGATQGGGEGETVCPAAAVVQNRLEAMRAAGAGAPVSPPPLRQVLAECWAYLRWSLKGEAGGRWQVAGGR